MGEGGVRGGEEAHEKQEHTPRNSIQWGARVEGRARAVRGARHLPPSRDAVASNGEREKKRTAGAGAATAGAAGAGAAATAFFAI